MIVSCLHILKDSAILNANVVISSVPKSVVCFSIAVWFGAASKQDWTEQTAADSQNCKKYIGYYIAAPLPSVQDLYIL